MTNPALLETTPLAASAIVPAAPKGSPAAASAFLWARTLLIGALLAMSYLGAVVVFGWLYRWVQGQVLHAWWRRSPLRGLSFEGFCAEMGPDGPCLHPNWFLRQRPEPGEGSLLGALRSLWLNGRVGFLGILATCLLVGWGCLLMAFSWEYGWNASFHKDHELRLVGRATATLGIALFMAAMVYVPMAQVHHAVTGDFRAFFEFRFVGKLIRARLGGYVLFSALFLLVAIVLENLKTIPTGLDDHIEVFSNLGDRELRRFFQVYYFSCSVILLLALLATRLILLRLYHGAVLAVVRRGEVSGAELHPRLAKWLTRLELLPGGANPFSRDAESSERSAGATSAPRLARISNAESSERSASGTSPKLRSNDSAPRRLNGPVPSRLFSRAAALVLLLAIWFGFVCKVYVGEFFNYHPGLGFLNHPLIQVPCCNYLPDHLR